jgi:hypothetical protein
MAWRRKGGGGAFIALHGRCGAVPGCRDEFLIVGHSEIAAVCAYRLLNEAPIREKTLARAQTP